MMLISAYKTDVGREAKYNQDYIWVDEQKGIFIVADGMGGAEAGELASELAAITTGQFIAASFEAKTHSFTPKALLVGALEAANDAVMAKAKELNQSRPMGAAIVVALVQLDKAYITHAGDARAYLANQAALTRLTTDDSWVARLVESGLVTEEQGRHHPLGNILTKAVGHESPLEPTFTEVTVAPGDWLLLCSDGLLKMFSDEQIQAEFAQNDRTPTQLVERLVEAANSAGGKDNISAVVIKISA
jgi:protein phosphatase